MNGANVPRGGEQCAIGLNVLGADHVADDIRIKIRFALMKGRSH